MHGRSVQRFKGMHISMHLCMYVYTYLCFYVFMDIWICVSMHRSIYVSNLKSNLWSPQEAWTRCVESIEVACVVGHLPAGDCFAAFPVDNIRYARITDHMLRVRKVCICICICVCVSIVSDCCECVVVICHMSTSQAKQLMLNLFRMCQMKYIEKID
jgi:hypothetical protein